MADQGKDWKTMRQQVSAVKVLMPKVLHDVSSMALHLHGSLGFTTEMPFTDHLMNSFMIGLADGPTEVHKLVVAKEMLRDVVPSTEQFPAYHRQNLRNLARARFGLDGE